MQIISATQPDISTNVLLNMAIGKHLLEAHGDQASSTKASFRDARAVRRRRK